MARQDKQLVFGQDLADKTPELFLKLKQGVRLPLEAENINCDNFSDKTIEEIKNLTVYQGRQKATLGDFFEVTGKPSDKVLVEGDLKNAKRIGQNMTRGFLWVKGDTGPHLGAYMTGGVIYVEGSVGDYAGAHMKEGRIWITGDAGNFLGSAYAGETKGVNKGVIVVLGNAGSDSAIRMRRGLIVVKGNLGDFAGQAMLAGTILCFGNLGDRAGAANKRGSIVALGEKPVFLPTYHYDCTYRPTFLGVLFRRLKAWGLDVSEDVLNGFFERYTGDLNILSKGEILVLK